MFQKYIMCPQAAYHLAREIKLIINISFTSLKVPKTHKEDMAKMAWWFRKGNNHLHKHLYVVIPTMFP